MDRPRARPAFGISGAGLRGIPPFRRHSFILSSPVAERVGGLPPQPAQEPAPAPGKIGTVEPVGAAPLVAAVRQGLPATRVEVEPTDAYSIVTPVSGYRGVVALRDSGGRPLLVSDEQMRAAQFELARTGLWVELSSAAGLAGLRSVEDISGPVVCISTSSGFKDRTVGSRTTETVAPEWEEVHRRLRAAGIRE